MAIQDVVDWQPVTEDNVGHHPAGPQGEKAIRISQSFRELQAAIARFNEAAVFDGNVVITGTLRQLERADHAFTPTATFGELWLKDEAPNELFFTDDAGTDFPISINAVMHLSKDVQQDVGGVASTVTFISWDATAIKKDPGFTHEDSVNPTRIQVDHNGRYSIKWMISATQGGSARTTLMSAIRHNGSTVISRGRQRNYSRGSSFGDISLGMVTELDLSSGDYIEALVTVDQTDGTYTINTINASCEMIIRRLS